MFYKLQFKIHASALLSVDILHDLQCLCYYHSLDSFIHSTYAIESLFHLRLAARVTTTHRYTFHVCIYILRSRDEPRLDFAVAAERMEIAWYATMDFVVARESGKRALFFLRIRFPDFHQCCCGNALNIYPADAIYVLCLPVVLQ